MSLGSSVVAVTSWVVVSINVLGGSVDMLVVLPDVADDVKFCILIMLRIVVEIGVVDVVALGRIVGPDIDVFVGIFKVVVKLILFVVRFVSFIFVVVNLLVVLVVLVVDFNKFSVIFGGNFVVVVAVAVDARIVVDDIEFTLFSLPVFPCLSQLDKNC